MDVERHRNDYQSLMKTNNNEHFVSSINVSLNDKTMLETMQPKETVTGQNGTGAAR